MTPHEEARHLALLRVHSEGLQLARERLVNVAREAVKAGVNPSTVAIEVMRGADLPSGLIIDATETET